jgi:hypothetical protein
MPKGDTEFERLDSGAFLAYLYCFVRFYFILFSFRIIATVRQVRQSWSFSADLTPSGMLINVDTALSGGRVSDNAESFMMRRGSTQKCC